MENLKLKILRTNLQQTYTEGVLIHENINRILCDTLEDKVRDADGSGDFEGDEEKVYGATAIPYGEYDIEVTWSPAFSREMVLIKNVPQFTGVRIHWGRTADNTEGCPLVGEKYADGMLRNSDMTNKLVDLVKSHGNKGKLKIE